MSLFRFAIYFAVLVACAVAAFPYWAPTETDAETSPPTVYSVPPASLSASKKYAIRYHAGVPARMASRD